jgi:putative copper export protein
MAIIDRIDDAKHLAAVGRWEGALTMVLLAVAGASRMQFPKKGKSQLTDREAFLAYLRDKSMKVVGVHVSSAFLITEVDGKKMAIDEVL